MAQVRHAQSFAACLRQMGAKPMNITWRLDEPIPPYLWKDSAKMAVG